MLKIKECPHCKSKEGYYIKCQYSGSGIYRYSFDENEIDNSDMYDSLSGKYSKYYYCLNCNKRICKAENED